MVGINGSAEIVHRRPALLAACLAATAVGLSLLAGSEASAGPGSACVAAPSSLSPKGKPPKRYTMLLRVNKLTNVDEYANADPATGGLKPRIRDRDIFVINTRFDGSTPNEWVQIADALRGSFPCNRIVALNGLAPDPTKPGYSGALANYPGLWGLSIDWEQDDWNQGRKQSPGIPPWTNSFRKSLGRIGKRLNQLGAASQKAIGAPGRRTGIVPAYYSAWDYGLVARTADRRNQKRKKGRRGFQVVQSQGYCLPSGPGAFHAITDRLFEQYRPKPKIKKKRVNGKVRKVKVKVKPRGKINTLALEISFSNTPDPSDPRPVASLPPGAAGKCTRISLKRGGGAYLYWAHPDSIRALLNTKHVCPLRPRANGC
jgi:hypothetical protein